MSYEAMAWGMSKKLPQGQKMVLMALANRADRITGQCFPSHDSLAEDAGMDKRSVIRHIDKLEELKVIGVIRETRKVNHYQLPIEEIKKFIAEMKKQDSFNSDNLSPLNNPIVTDCHPIVTDCHPSIVTNCHSNQSDINQSLNQILSTTENVKTDSTFSLTQEQHDCFNLVMAIGIENGDRFWFDEIGGSVGGDKKVFLAIWNNPKRKLQEQYRNGELQAKKYRANAVNTNAANLEKNIHGNNAGGNYAEFSRTNATKIIPFKANSIADRLEQQLRAIEWREQQERERIVN